MHTIRPGQKAQTVAAQSLPLRSVSEVPADPVHTAAPSTLAERSRLMRGGDIFVSGERRMPGSEPETGPSPFDTSEYFLMLGGTTSLELGSRGPAVEVLQRALMLVAEKTGIASLGLPSGGADGVYGMEVDGAVRALQQRVGLKPTGNFGASEAAQLLVLLSDAENAIPGSGASRGVRGLPALEAQLGLGELLETSHDEETGRDVRIYEQGRVELLPELGVPALVELDGVRLPGAVVLRALENELGVFKRVNSDGFAQLHFEFSKGSVTTAGGQVLEATLPAGGPQAVADALGMGVSLGRGPSLTGHGESFAEGELVYDSTRHVLSRAIIGTPEGPVELSAAVIEVALFRELGAFESSSSENWENEGALTRLRFARGSIVLGADGGIRDVQIERRMPA